jgi:hypothetical protein
MDELTRNRYPAVDWKQDLRVSRRHFKEHEGFGEGIASACNAVERYVMQSALAFRKLLDQRLLTEEVITADWRVRTYPCNRRPEPHWYFEGMIDMENLHHFVRYYDVERPRGGTLRLQRLANLLIHSFVFAVWPSDGGSYDEARFFFNSDHSKDALVYEMTAAEFKAVVDEVLYDEVVYMERVGTDGDFRQHNHAWREAQRGFEASKQPVSTEPDN